MKTRPLTPTCFSASFRPLYASALKPLSFRPPMSVTSATLSGRCLCLRGFAEPAETTASARTATERERRNDHPFANRHIPSLVVHLTGLPHL